jgi:integrase
VILVAYRHGLRGSELCELTWDAIDFRAATMHVNRKKNGQSTTHRISGPELRAPRKLQKEQGPKSACVKDTRSIQAYLGDKDIRHRVRYTQTDVGSEKMIRINPHQRPFLATLAVSSRAIAPGFSFRVAELVAQALDELRDWAEVNGSGDCRHCQPGEHHLPAWIPTDHHSTLWSNGRV